MIEHKCSLKEFVRMTSGLALSDRVRKKIQVTSFGHYLYFSGRLDIDSSLLDDSCGRWESGNAFSFGALPGKQIIMTPEEIGQIVNIPWTGREINLKAGDYISTFDKQYLRNHVMSRFYLRSWQLLWRRKTKHQMTNTK